MMTLPIDIVARTSWLHRAFAGVAVFVSLVSVCQADETPGMLPHVSRYVDLNHEISTDMETYPGLSMVKFSEFMPRFPNSALIDQAALIGITGTYIDAPFHEDPHGAQIADYPLEKLVNLPAVVVTKSASRVSFEVEDFKDVAVEGKAVLLFSGHDRKFGTPAYAVDAPYLSVAAAKWLVAHKAALVGIDSQLIDNFATADKAIPVHHELLTHGVVICEDMTNLGALPTTGSYLTAVPPRVPMTSFPARVFATIFSSR